MLHQVFMHDALIPKQSWPQFGKSGDTMSDSETLQVISVTTTIALAFIGYIVTYHNNVKLENRKAKLKYISDQLQYLYGPLFSLSNASNTAWITFRSRYRPKGAFFSADNPPTQEELEQWIVWVSEVFMPINTKIEKSIIENAHLIEGREMPIEFKDFLAHVESYKATLKNWERGDFSSYTSLVNFPDGFHDHIGSVYAILKWKQITLIEKIRS